MFGPEVEVEVLKPAEPAKRQAEPRWQLSRCPTIDEELGAIFQGAGGEVIRIVLARQLAHVDMADLAAPAAPVNVIRNDPRPWRWMKVEPLTRFGIGV